MTYLINYACKQQAIAFIPFLKTIRNRISQRGIEKFWALFDIDERENAHVKNRIVEKNTKCFGEERKSPVDNAWGGARNVFQTI